MSEVKMKMMDGNEAAASVAHRMNEVCVIYPITPSSPMGEWADAWSAAKQKNLWGVVPEVQEMQSEAGRRLLCMWLPVLRLITRCRSSVTIPTL